MGKHKLLFKIPVILDSLIRRIFRGGPIHQATASVVDWDILPENPVLGDALEIKGKATPDENIGVSVSFERIADVSDGEYVYELDNVNIPKGSNSFTIEGRGVENLNFTVKMFVDLVKNIEASAGVAVFSDSNVPSGNYDIRIDGRALEGVSTVSISMTASNVIPVGSDGNFSYIYETGFLPEGEFVIDVAGTSKKIILVSDRS